MFQYIIKRFVYFLPTLLIISFLVFGLSKCVPNDPIDPPQNEISSKTDLSNAIKDYERLAEIYGLTGPAFYFDFTSQAYPDTLHKIIYRDHREHWSNLIAQYGNWNEISKYKDAIQTTQLQLFEVPDTIAQNEVIKIRSALSFLYVYDKDDDIQRELDSINVVINNSSTLFLIMKESVGFLNKSYSDVKDKATPSKLLIPTFQWHGFDNQYHRWFTNFITGDFGIAYRSMRPVLDELKEAIFWTLIINLISIFFAYIISIPLGIFSAKNKDSRMDRMTTVILFVLYSLPSFWIATMLVVFITSPEYGMNWFDTSLPYCSSTIPFWTCFWSTASNLVLPIFCITYASLAFISRQMRGGMLDVLQQDYIRTARAKGLSENKVVWIHGFRNSLFPIITLFASVFPRAIAGSVVIEIIFNIPGMGKLAFDAIMQSNWPIVFAVLMLVATMTMIGALVADILYAVADPRISFNQNKKE